MRLPVMMILALGLLSIIVDTGIWAIVRKFPHRRYNTWTVCWWTIAAILYILLAIVIIAPRRSEDVDIQTSMWILYSYLTVYAGKTVALIFGLLGFLPRLFKGKARDTFRWVGIPLAFLIFIIMWWGAIETRREIEVRKAVIESTKLPEEFDGYRIVQISDMHVGTWGKDTTFISNLVDTVLAHKPDLIVFTGDIVNRHTLELEPFLNTLSRLKAPDGTLSILGNHDYGDYISWNNPDDKVKNRALLEEWEKAMGWKLLNNEHLFITRGTDSIAVIGVENWGEPPFHQYGRLEDAYPLDPDSDYNVNDSRFKILLSHNPEHWNRVISKSTNIDLTLSGHTHAMQFEICLGDFSWSPAVWKYKQWGGLYEQLNDNNEPTKIYVNIGSGEVGMPFRIGAIPEVTVLTFKRIKE